MAQANQIAGNESEIVKHQDGSAAKQAFAPIIGVQPRVMVLGSLPGDASLAVGQYYAHPRNQFWRLLSDISGVDLLSLSYADKLQKVQQIPLIMWDVVAEAKRLGSLDSAIREAEVRDIAALQRLHPSVVQVWFNGGQAAKWGIKSLQAA